MALPKPAGTGAKEEISLDAAASHLLEECRMVLPGIQALFGFQLIAIFNQGFDAKLGHAAQMVHLVALMLTALAMALVMTPAALHRVSEPKSVSERFVWMASKMVLAGMVPLAIGVGLDTYVVASVVTASTGAGIVLGTVLLGVFAWLWFLLPRREHSRHHVQRRR